MIEHLQANVLAADIAEKCSVNMDVVVHKSIDSTNTWALQQCKNGRYKEGAGLPFVCFAEQQTQGRGRRGKQWVMPAGSNIAMSLVWPFPLSYQQMTLLPLSIAVAIAETLESFELKQVQIKWPNDVYVRGRKIAGILIETQMPGGGQSTNPASKKPAAEKQSIMIIGVGLNYDMTSLLEKIRMELPAFTDLSVEFNLRQPGKVSDKKQKCMPERVELASVLLQHIVSVCSKFQHDAKYNLEKFRSSYDYCRGKTVELILDDGQILEGIAQGVDDNAELRVIVDGKERLFNSADVSIKAK